MGRYDYLYYIYLFIDRMHLSVWKSDHDEFFLHKMNTHDTSFNNWPCGSMAERLTTISSSKMKLVYQEVPGSTPGSVNLFAFCFLHFCPLNIRNCKLYTHFKIYVGGKTKISAFFA